METIEKIPSQNSLDFISELDGGDLSYMVSQSMEELIQAIRENQQSGYLVLKIEIKPSPEYGADAVKVIPDIKIKKPTRKCSATMRFITENNVLSKDDPRQMRLKLN